MRSERPPANGAESPTLKRGTLARNIGQALVNRGLTPDRPIAILSGNDLEHALLCLGAMYAGVPFAPISTGYSLLSHDFAKLKYILDLVTPGLVFASSGSKFQRALDATLPPGAELVCTEDPLPGATRFSELTSTNASGPLPHVTAIPSSNSFSLPARPGCLRA